jgi:hypothetical protein
LTPGTFSLFGADSPNAIRRYLAGVDYEEEIIFAGLDTHGLVRAAVRVRALHASRWAELFPTREARWVGAASWRGIVGAAVAAARAASIGWLSVASLGYDPETRDALEWVGFDLQAEEEGTIGELCLLATAYERLA